MGLVRRQGADRSLGAVLARQFPALAYAPIAFITGQTGKNVKALLNHATMLFKQARERVATAS